jgi:hypothetical protein
MNIEERIGLTVRLGDYLLMNDETLRAAKEKAREANPWFTAEFVDIARAKYLKQFSEKRITEQVDRRL